MRTPQWDDVLDWLPVLSRHLARGPGHGPLVLDARAPQVPLDAVRAMLDTALERCDGTAEVVLLDDPEVPVPVAAPDPPAAAAPPDDPVALLASARAAKAIADAVRDAGDRAAMPAPRPVGDRPLVTVPIATYGDAHLLVTRAIPSVLNGSYEHVEVVVCSDGPQPHAREAVSRITDPRVRYLELPERPTYPSEPWSFWLTAGVHAGNAAIAAARGEWLAVLDHDDAFTTTHIADLLERARATGAELVYGQGLMEQRDGPFRLVGTPPLTMGQVLHGAVLRGPRTLHLRYDPLSWVDGDPGDFAMLRRVQDLPVGVAHLPEVTVVHFRERTSLEGRGLSAEALQGPLTPEPADLAADILGTDAVRLLGFGGPAPKRRRLWSRG